MGTRTIEIGEEVWHRLNGWRRSADESDAEIVARLVPVATASGDAPVSGTPVERILARMDDPTWPGFMITHEEEALMLSVDQPIRSVRDIE